MESELSPSTDTDLLGQKPWIESVLKKYNVSWSRGFIPEEDPLVCFRIDAGLRTLVTNNR